MTHTYRITGMTCSGCEATVKSALLTLPEVTSVEVSRADDSATITMTKHIALNELQKAIGTSGKYNITTINHSEQVEQTKSWVETYRPILLIFGYLTIVSLIVSWNGNGFGLMPFMQTFTAGFFLTFSFFKMLDLKGFAESYATYDIVAKRFKQWGYIYAFVELGFGFAYAANLYPIALNGLMLIVMSISIAGVLQSVWNKQKIQCACLGTVFNLPMSTVTIIEDALMILMSGIMLVKLCF